MTARDDDLVREVAREVLAEVLPGLLEEALVTAARTENGHEPVQDGQTTAPRVPAPPVATVHRPTGWRPPDGAAGSEDSRDGIEWVSLGDDAALGAFVHALARRLENADERSAILGGRLTFRLASSARTSERAVIRIESGAATERVVKKAAETGARLVLSPRAVLTPMARDCARSLGVQIEKEAAC